MFQRGNWNVAFGVFFIVAGLLSLLVSNGLNAAWSLIFGIGNLGIAYAQKHPEKARGVLAWGIAIVWGGVFIWLTILLVQN